jgi:hypothetical protein
MSLSRNIHAMNEEQEILESPRRTKAPHAVYIKSNKQ